VKSRLAGGALVYSTDGGRMCPGCRNPVAQCSCAEAKHAVPVSGGAVRVWRETKGRGGKAVTLVKGLALDGLQLAQLAHQVKAACGSGGTVKSGVIEVQGDHCDKVIALLQALGHAAKRAGA